MRWENAIDQEYELGANHRSQKSEVGSLKVIGYRVPISTKDKASQTGTSGCNGSHGSTNCKSDSRLQNAQRFKKHATQSEVSVYGGLSIL